VQDGRGGPDGPPEGHGQPASTQAKKRVGSFNEAAHKLPTQSLPREEDSDEGSEHENLDTAGRTNRAAALAAASADGDQSDVVAHAGRAALALGALGVVYGDIGTSPLYTEQVIFGQYRATQHIAVAGVYGVVSLIFWALAIVVSMKYAGFIMRAHNRGDGGIMALAALCQRLKVPRRALMVTLGIFGASLFFGDGMITPAISVLSAVSGLEVATPGVAHLVVPISLVILVGLFVLQRKGTGTVGGLFGPVMFVWFATLVVIGLPEIFKHPGVLQALSPIWGVRFFIDHGFYAFLALGGVVLAVTGAEALYADRGHFGPKPIRMAWFVVVWPGVLVNYLGQAAWILDHPHSAHEKTFNPFFSVMPSWAVVPMVILATVATVIASQAVISGSYSVARQAMQLGYLPRLRVVHTSKMEGQIYVPAINWMLMLGVVGLVLIFRNSNGLANAYGVAVTGTFILNTVLFVVVAKRLWHTPTWMLAGLGTLFLTVEVTFFLANAAKILHGAWLPLAAGLLISIVMLTWRRGQVIVTRNRQSKEGGLNRFLDHLGEMRPPVGRVPGTAIFLVPDGATPLALRGVVEHVHTLHETVLVVSVQPASVPHVDPNKRFVVKRVGRGLFHVLHVTVRNGYQETNSVPAALALARKQGVLPRNLDLEGASYFLSRITIAPTDKPGMARWRKKLFVMMARNSASPMEHFGLPNDRTVVMGSQINL
jgi:KUP system potassium uptake protein